MTNNLGNVIGTAKIVIRPAYKDDWDDSMSLAWRTFMKFEAGDYTKEGVESFQNFITDSILYKMFILGEYQLFVACDDQKVVGMVTLRNETHISLLFVDEKYHRLGIGRGLMEYVSDYVKNEEGHRVLTVDAAPYATGFYHRIGFVDTGILQMNDGIYFTPMEMSIR
jgi:ribosomal protein S18 acetylase RimI-like enzyme